MEKSRAVSFRTLRGRGGLGRYALSDLDPARRRSPRPAARLPRGWAAGASEHVRRGRLAGGSRLRRFPPLRARPAQSSARIGWRPHALRRPVRDRHRRAGDLRMAVIRSRGLGVPLRSAGTAEENLRALGELWTFFERLSGQRFPPGVHCYRSMRVGDSSCVSVGHPIHAGVRRDTSRPSLGRACGSSVAACVPRPRWTCRIGVPREAGGRCRCFQARLEGLEPTGSQWGLELTRSRSSPGAGAVRALASAARWAGPRPRGSCGSSRCW